MLSDSGLIPEQAKRLRVRRKVKLELKSAKYRCSKIISKHQNIKPEQYKPLLDW